MGLFTHPIYTKLGCLLFIALSCLGNRGIKKLGITWNHIAAALAAGALLFFGNGFLLKSVQPIHVAATLYIATLCVGYLCLMAAGLWMSRLIRNSLMKDVFNVENESFAQETQKMTNIYSINLPTLFYYKKRWNKGWINIVNPFRATSVLGTPGSGKTYAVIKGSSNNR